jgi:CHAP domain
MRTLAVTSPWMRGKDVETAQRILQGANRYKEDYLNGPVDGTFGPESGRAARRAKWYMGYPESTVKSDKNGPIYGDALNNYLTGKKKLPDAYENRRRARKNPALKSKIQEVALRNAIAKLGEMESPAGSNRVNWASEWYRLIGPWCAMAVTRWYVDAGSKAFRRGSAYAYCPYVVNDARRGSNHLSVTRNPVPGDLVLFDWAGDGIADHIGLFEKWQDRSAGTFQSIEGNTSRDDSGSQSNGGGCFRRGERPGRGDTRRTGNVQCFVHVGG